MSLVKCNGPRHLNVVQPVNSQAGDLPSPKGFANRTGRGSSGTWRPLAAHNHTRVVPKSLTILVPIGPRVVGLCSRRSTRQVQARRTGCGDRMPLASLGGLSWAQMGSEEQTMRDCQARSILPACSLPGLQREEEELLSRSPPDG